MHISFVKLSGSTIEILHIMILHFSNINLLTAVSKFYMKPISSFYREQELTSHQQQVAAILLQTRCIWKAGGGEV